LNDFQDAGIDAFMDMSTSEFKFVNTYKETQILDTLAKSIERQICGYKRRLRKCNECRYQLGDLRSQMVLLASGNGQNFIAGANLGTKLVPIVRSRRLYIGTFVHRLFPGFLTNLPTHTEEADQAPMFTIYRLDSRERMFTMYMIRCPGCSSWKEMAAFRCAGHWPKWWLAHQHRWGERLWDNWDGTAVEKDFVEGLRCHACYAALHGRDAFAKVMLEWYIEYLIADTWILHRHMLLGWDLIWRMVDSERSINVSPGDWYAPKQYHFDIQSQILAGLPWKDPRDKNKGIAYFTSDEETIQILNQKHKRLKENMGKWLVRSDLDNDPTSHWNDWLGSWMGGYDNLEAQWVWFRDCKKEILRRPEALVEWALGDQGAVNVDPLEVWGRVSAKLGRKWTDPDVKEI
jgi:hypothetical protein